MSSVEVVHGDCLDVLASLPESSVDSVCTDPPYRLEFMGRDWDRFSGAVTDRDFKGFVLSQQRTRNVKCPECNRWAYDHPGRLCECGGIRRAQGNAYQAWCEQWAAAALRVLKPGGHLLAFGGTRTWHRMTCAIEDAGFEYRNTLAWLYGSGFPKSLNLDGGLGTALKPAFEPIVLMRKPLVGTVAANVLVWGTGALNIDATRIEGVPPSVPQPDFRSVNARATRLDANKRNGEMSSAAGRWPANVVLDEAAAEQLDTQTGDLRPGERPARQNVPPGTGRTMGDGWHGDGNGIRTVLDSGGASRFMYTAKASSHDRPEVWHCDHCETVKLEGWENEDPSATIPPATVTPPPRDTTVSSTKGASDSPTTSSGNSTTDPSPTATKSITSTATSKTTASKTSSSSPPPSTNGSTADAKSEPTDGGNLALFAGYSSPSPASTGTSRGKGGRSTAAAAHATSPRSSNPSVCDVCGSAKRQVSHPTVKPVELMRWLVRLVTPSDGIVLDPFAGSGTTGVAAVIEGRQCVLIEREAEYVDIIRRRLAQPIEPVLDFGGAA